MDAELITFPDSEDVIRQYLAAELETGIGVYGGSLPAKLPAASVRVRSTGGSSLDLVIGRGQVTVEARARLESDAADLAEAARALIGQAARDGVMAGVPCYRVEEYSIPYLDPDPVNPGLARYTATYRVWLRAAAGDRITRFLRAPATA